MATALDPALAKKPFTNWLKGALAVLFAREGLTEFVQNEISDFQRDLLQSIFIQNAIPSGTTCSSCTTANVLKCPTQEFCGRKRPCKLHDPSVKNKTPNQKCPKKICHHIKDAILNHHRFHGPTWEITDATRWCSDPFEIAKCYLPPKGYCNKTSLVEIDFNGTLGIVINNTRFQNKLAAQLNIAPNICSKVRDMINDKVRHSASYELSDVELAQIIDGLQDLLQDTKFLLHDQHAKDAVIKLNHLKNNTLVITAGDITKVLDEDISKRISEQQQEAIQSILDHLAKVKEVSVACLGEIIEARDTAIKAIQQEAEQQIKNVKQSVKETDDVLFKDLKEDLMTYYRENESMIPAAPLVDEHKVPIEELYVLPPMWAYDKPLSFGLGKNTQTGEQRSDAQGKQETSVSQLFLSDKNVRYRKIYITADAGFGKTSLSQKLTMTWCQSHSPLTSLTKKYKGDELAAMRYFDFLFLLHLRDYQSEPLCNLDDLIIQMLSNNLSRNTLYTKEFLQRLLHDKTCLILLDGLDEWAHPDKCRRTPSVPHNNHPDSCTVLTTSRPWKLGTIGLSEHNIDRHIEISELDRRTRDKLETNAIRILNERNLNRAGKRIEAFDKAAKSVEIGDIIYNPYILLQLMCVFFGGLPIGKSKCEIYSNITEFSLVRGLKKPDLPDIQVQTNDNALVPNCMNENETCKRYYILLLKLGKLAFYTLFSENKESSLIFDRRIVNQYMTEQEIEFCLKVGLLCQTKDSSIIAVKRYHVFFQHKSVHEFFSAIYITSEFQNESVKSNILNVCSSLSGILEMSNVFVFVCGINPEVYTCISGELQTIVDLDEVTRPYRTYIDSDYDAWGTMKSYQSMQVQCLQECVRNGHDSCYIHLQDYILPEDNIITEEDLTSLKIIINFNKGNVKSLQLSDPDQKTEFMQSLVPDVFTSLETLRVQDGHKEPVWLADILTESARTLKCLTLPTPYPDISLSAISITALTGLTCLQSLYLLNVNMTHSNLKCLYAYISQTTTLTQLRLEYIYCSDHRRQYRVRDVTLDLHRLNVLKMLHLYLVPCRELHVNPACLEKLEFSPWKKMTARASATLWQDLRAAPVLSSLELERMRSCQEMIQTIPTLTQLQYLKLEEIDMGDVIPISPAMTQLERVELSHVTMSSAAWQGLFVSVDQLPRSITVQLSFITMTSQEWRELLLSVGQLQHPVTVELSYCRGPSEEDWRTIVNVIKTTPTLSLLQDFSFSRDWRGVDGASLTLKNQ